LSASNQLDGKDNFGRTGEAAIGEDMPELKDGRVKQGLAGHLREENIIRRPACRIWIRQMNRWLATRGVESE
jgi:hypothetical protein